MKKIFIAVFLSLLLLSSCAMIPGMGTTGKTAPVKTAPATTPTLLERISALETQNLNNTIALTSLKDTVDKLKPPDGKTIDALQAQIFTMQQQLDEQTAEIAKLQGK